MSLTFQYIILDSGYNIRLSVKYVQHRATSNFCEEKKQLFDKRSGDDINLSLDEMCEKVRNIKFLINS